MDPKLNELKHLLSKDARKADRIALVLKFYYSTPNNTRFLIPFKTDKISGDGIKFNSKKPLKEKTEINIKIILKHPRKTLFFSGIIIWCKKTKIIPKNASKKVKEFYSIGVKFSKMTDNDRKLFVNYISNNLLTSIMDNNEIIIL
ncbi:MAG: PilZ domain-containing protein [Candidatus Omnitrophica bacterium]|nr:PilZ domain-containing protein [Candidatus Omnitrophota bacterium]